MRPGSASATRVVIRLPNRIVKGYIDREEWEQQRQSSNQAASLSVRSPDDDQIEILPLHEAKAVFFVRDFEGIPQHADLRFHDHLPPPECLWIRLVFLDGEILEGMIENGPQYVLDAGFFVTPTDPTANNWLIYIPKPQIKRFEVLGLRQRTPSRIAALL